MKSPAQSWLAYLVILIVGLSSRHANAQSSVTLYGVVDVVIDVSKQGKGLLVREMSGNTIGSRWGLKGSEDLGGGWKTVFTLENGFGANDGAAQQGGLLFGRQAFVGLSGPTGSFTFGRQYSPEFWAFGANDPYELGMAGGLSNTFRTLPNGNVAGVVTAFFATSRVNNSVVYTSPNLGGLTVRLLYSFGGVAGSFVDGSTISGALQYAAGPLALNAGYTKSVESDGSGEYIAYTVGGNYAVGRARLYLSYSRDTDTSANTPTQAGPKLQHGIASIGLRFQFAPDLMGIAQVAKVIDTSDASSSAQSAFVESVGLLYYLSKTTLLFAAYGQVQNRHGSAYSLGGALYSGGSAMPDATGRTLQLGMRTQF